MTEIGSHYDGDRVVEDAGGPEWPQLDEDTLAKTTKKFSELMGDSDFRSLLFSEIDEEHRRTDPAHQT